MFWHYSNGNCSQQVDLQSLALILWLFGNSKKNIYWRGVTSHIPNLHLHTLFSEMFNSILPLTFLDSCRYFLLSDQRFYSFIKPSSQLSPRYTTSSYPEPQDLWISTSLRISDSTWTSSFAKLHSFAISRSLDLYSNAFQNLSEHELMQNFMKVPRIKGFTTFLWSTSNHLPTYDLGPST